MTALANASLNRDLPLQIKISAEYFCDPVWVTGQDVMEDSDGSALGLDDQLVRDLRDWSEAYNATYNDDDPSESAPLPVDHYVRGFVLAARVRREMPPAWTVIAKDPENGKEAEVPFE